MKTKTELPKLIGIKGMLKFFGCSRPTLYSKYMPSLKRFPTTDNRVMYEFKDVEALKKKIQVKEYEEIDVEKIIK